MPKREEEILDLSKTLYCRKAFKGAGRTFLPGQVVDWKKLAMDTRRVRMMFEQRWLTHDDSHGADDADQVSQEQIDAHSDFSMNHKGGGWYEVVNKQGEPVNEKSLKKDEAIALLEDLNK